MYDSPQVFTCAIHDPNPSGTTTVNVALHIHLHAVGDAWPLPPQVAKDPVSGQGQGTVGLNVDGAYVPATGVVDVEHALVRRESQPVG